jgi:hypothetical protein
VPNQEIVEPLTADEETVLAIAAEGKSMMPIGRWEAPTLSLWQRKFLYRHDDFNFTITHGGKAALEAHRKAQEVELRDAFDRHKQAIEQKKVEASSAVAKAYYDGPDRS